MKDTTIIKENIIQEKAFSFALSIIELYQKNAAEKRIHTF